jgi:hypothetical protein
MAHATTAAQDSFGIVNVEQVARLDASYLSIGILGTCNMHIHAGMMQYCLSLVKKQA